jgi:hypothetical protein
MRVLGAQESSLVESSEKTDKSVSSAIDFDLPLQVARRTAFVARFIVLREGKRTKAHRVIETMSWEQHTTAEELAKQFRDAFIQNGDNMRPVDRDLRRSLAHANRSLNHFVNEYAARGTTNFIDALFDYDRSNALLFGSEGQPRLGGWRLPSELTRLKGKV